MRKTEENMTVFGLMVEIRNYTCSMRQDSVNRSTAK